MDSYSSNKDDVSKIMNHIVQNEGSRESFAVGRYKTYGRSNSHEKFVKQSSQIVDSNDNSPQRINIEEDKFYFDKQRHITRVEGHTKGLKKNLSQAEIISAVKQTHLNKTRDGIFENLNAAINELNGSSIKPRSMLPKDDHYETEATSNDLNALEIVKKRRLSGNMAQKDSVEVSVDANDEESAKVTAHFNNFMIEQRESNVRKYNVLNEEFEPEMTVNEELLQFQLHRPQTSRKETPSHHLPKPKNESISKNYLISSSRSKIPKDPNTKRFGMHSNRIKRSQLRNNKTHQLSINLRKGSPIQAEVDLFSSNSIVKDPLDNIVNIKNMSNNIDFGTSKKF